VRNFNRINDMGIKRKLLKGAGYLAAPKLAFALDMPKKAAMAKATSWALGHVTHRRRRPSMGMTAAKGLGAAAVALPLGMWLGRRMMERESGALHE
jgi:hypothetical protein